MDLLEEGLARFLRERLPQPLKLTLTDNRRALFSYRRRPDGVGELRLARYFALADRETLDALAAYLTGEIPRLPSSVRAFADRQLPPASLIRQARLKARPAGEHFDLSEVVGRVLARFFPQMRPVSITWGRRPSALRRRAGKRTIQLGSYRPDDDLVTIHPALDAPYVPPVYLEMVVFHELLHRQQAQTTPPGVRPRLVHDRRFRVAERLFEGYEEALRWEKAHLSRLLSDRSAAKK
ncbi:MAG: hypothetical protein HQK87_04990 [Nitrospinae bacterium]|nr:hypothetical protein [Nitrospinota bacterium]